jgi:hypothetical protein
VDYLLNLIEDIKADKTILKCCNSLIRVDFLKAQLLTEIENERIIYFRNDLI